MNSVVLTVKASYIASTKYRNKLGNKEVRINCVFFFVQLYLFFLLFAADCTMENAFTRKETIDSVR